MAYTTGTAANYKDLLAILATFAAANGWVILEQSPTLLYLKGTGLAGLDEIYCGVETYEDPPNDRYNWSLYGSWGYKAGRDIDKHPITSALGVSEEVNVYLWNAQIPYWLVATPRRIIVAAKVGTTYQFTHLGLLDTPATDAQYPYPLLIGGMGNTSTQNYSGALYSFWKISSFSSGRISCPGGAWGSLAEGTDRFDRPLVTVATRHENYKDQMLAGLDGTYFLEPFFYVGDRFTSIFGNVDGLYHITGFNNTAENIITVAGVNYMVFPDGNKSGFGDFCALRLN